MADRKTSFERMLETFNIEDFAAIKLMEEITEIEQEIDLKRSQVRNRMTLLRRLLQKHADDDKKEMIEKFLLKIKADDRVYLMDEEQKE